MSREILVATPENIEIEYELGGVGSRLLANLVDSLIQVVAFLAFVIVAFLAVLLLGMIHLVSTPFGDLFSGLFAAIGSFVVFLFIWGYYIYFEIAWNGQTPGKRQMGLRVVRDGGYPVNAFSVITRNLLRVVDGIPLVVAVLLFFLVIQQAVGDHARTPSAEEALLGFSLLVTLCFMLFSARYQRLGDFVAGTMVVKQRAPRVPTLEALAPPPRVLPEHLAAYALQDIGRHVYEMTVPEYRAVRHYLDRRWQLAPMTQQYAAMRLAIPLMERLGIRPPEGVTRVNYADFLEYLAVAFEQYRGVK